MATPNQIGEAIDCTSERLTKLIPQISFGSHNPTHEDVALFVRVVLFGESISFECQKYDVQKLLKILRDDREAIIALLLNEERPKPSFEGLRLEKPSPTEKPIYIPRPKDAPLSVSLTKEIAQTMTDEPFDKIVEHIITDICIKSEAVQRTFFDVFSVEKLEEIAQALEDASNQTSEISKSIRIVRAVKISKRPSSESKAGRPARPTGRGVPRAVERF